MSMKRSRRANTPAKTQEAEGPFSFGNVPAPAKTWAEVVADKPDTEFKPYALTTTFARNDLVQHSKFGKGVVTLAESTRVEVLFEEGLKKLAHSGG